MNASRFVHDFLPRWLAAVRDPAGGFHERLGPDASPVDAGEPKTTLAQARTCFALSQLALATGEGALIDDARAAFAVLDGPLRHPDGGYRASTVAVERRAYDQSFALLALLTLAKAAPGAVPESRVEDLLGFIDARLTDPADGSLFEDERMAREGARPGDRRSQNPHMHMLEAYLQAFELTGAERWLVRAEGLVSLARRCFFDPATGAVREFVAFDLSPLAGAEGERREPGHQYEWAWLLHRFADLGGDETARSDAERMVAFAQGRALRAEGPLAGAPFDAVDAAGRVTEETHLLWPLTEMGKLHAALWLRTGDPGHRSRVLRIEEIVFARFFASAGRPVFHNRLNGAGEILWDEALTRLVYHLALFVTEGARAGLWRHETAGAAASAPTKPILEEERP